MGVTGVMPLYFNDLGCHTAPEASVTGVMDVAGDTLIAAHMVSFEGPPSC